VARFRSENEVKGAWEGGYGRRRRKGNVGYMG